MMMNLKELWLSLVVNLEYTCIQYLVKRQNNKKGRDGHVLIRRLNAALTDHMCLCNCYSCCYLCGLTRKTHKTETQETPTSLVMT